MTSNNEQKIADTKEANNQLDRYVLETLWEIKEKYAPVMDQIGRIDEKMEEAMESYLANVDADNKVLPVVDLINAYRLALKCERKEMRLFRTIKDELVQSGLYRPDEIALDINELLASNGNVRALIGPIDYRAYYKAEMLANLELVWSSASLTALLHPSYLKKLHYVMGDLRVGHLTEPLHILATGGKADLRQLDDHKMLPDYKLALGDVYVSKYTPYLALEEIMGNLHITEDDHFDMGDLTSKVIYLGGEIYVPKVSDSAIPFGCQKTYIADEK